MQRSGGGNDSSRIIGPVNIASTTPGETVEFTVTCEENSRDCNKFYQYFSQNSKLVPISNFDVVRFYNWFDNMQTKERSLEKRYYSGGSSHRLKFKRATCEGRFQMVSITGCGSGKREQLYDIVRQLYGQTHFQMDSNKSPDGDVSQDSTQASNTIITADIPVESVDITPEVGVTTKLCSTEETHNLPTLTNRFEVIKSGKISTGTFDPVSLILPKDLFTKQKANSANLLLFKQFIYSQMELEFRVVINAPKFGQGKIIISWFPDGVDGVDSHYLDRRSMIQRPHVLIDLNVTNQATIRMPQQYRRTFVRNFQHESSLAGVAYANFCTFQMATFSSYLTGNGQPTMLPYQIFYRFIKAEFAGMSYAVELQGPGLLGTLVPEVALAEKLLKRTGFIGNQDKPYLEQVTNVCPAPRKNFCSGDGVSDSIPLTFSRQATVTTLNEYVNENDPINFESLAKKYGLFSEFNWTTSNSVGDEIWKKEISPTVRRMDDSGDDKILKNRIPTPLDYASSQFAFWRGTIDMKFLFVSTPFHTGTVQFEITFGRGANNIYDSSSVYTKTFQLGEQREMELTVPFIYDTPWRMTQPYVSWPRTAGSETGMSTSKISANTQSRFADAYCMSNDFVTNTKITCRVINGLTPLDNVSKKIAIIVLIRGGEDFELRSIVPNFWNTLQVYAEKDNSVISGNGLYFHQFPVFDTTVGEMECEEEYVVPRIAWQQKGGKFIGHKVKAVNKASKMHKDFHILSKGVELQNEPTDNFKTGIKLRHFHSTDNETDFKTMMRRNYFLKRIKIDKRLAGDRQLATYWDETLGKMVSLTYSTTSRFWLPCYLPCHGMTSFNMPGPGGSPISTIPTLFRHWRGSLRYTLVFDIVKSSIRVSYIPNMGTVNFGNLPQGHAMTEVSERPNEKFGDIIARNSRFAELGFATEICIPVVNPTISIMAPFDCMFNRCVTTPRIMKGDRSNANRVITREESTHISGHIVIECDEDVGCDIYISAGDDLNLMNFIGLTEYTSSLPNGLSEKYSRIAGVDKVVHQMEPSVISAPFCQNHISRNTKCEFQMFGVSDLMNDLSKTNTEIRSSLVGLDRNVDKIANITEVTMKNANYVMMDTNTRVGGTLTRVNDVLKSTDDAVKSSMNIMSGTSEQFNTVLNSVDDLTTKSTEFVEKIGVQMDTTLGRVDDTISKSNEILALLEPMVKKMNTLVMSVCPENINIVEFSKDFILDLVILIRNFDFFNFSVMFLKYITKLFTLQFDTICSRAEELMDILKKYTGVVTTEQAPGAKPVVSLLGFFISLLISILNIRHSRKSENFYDTKKETFNFVFDKRAPGYVNSIITLVERVFGAFSTAISWLMGEKNVNQTVLEVLKEKETEIAKFCMDVDEITDPSNRKVMRRPDMKAKIWKNLMFARALKKQLIHCSGNSAANTIMDYVRRMTKYCDEQWTSMANCPVRMEPRVYCIVGESNIGKSFLVDNLSIQLLKSIGYKCLGANPVFTRAPGRKNWDGFENQPIIRFDDYLNMTDEESVREQISDLYELKSTCEFLPPMADLSRKGDSGSPKGVILLCNRAFPEEAINGRVSFPDAVWRRRDKLIWARRKHEFANINLREMTEEQSSGFIHLEFKFVSPVDGSDGIGADRQYNDVTDWMSYQELVVFLIDDWVRFHEQEQRFARRRLELFSSDLPQFVRELSDPMDLFNFRAYEMMEEVNDNPENLPSRILERQINEVLTQIGNNVVHHQACDKLMEKGKLTRSAMQQLANELDVSHDSFIRNRARFHRGKCGSCEMTINSEDHDISLCRLGQTNLICLKCTNFGADLIRYKFQESCKHKVSMIEQEPGVQYNYFSSRQIQVCDDKYPWERNQRKRTMVRIMNRASIDYRKEEWHRMGVTFVVDSFDGREVDYERFISMCNAIECGEIPFFYPFVVEVIEPSPKSYQRLADEYLSEIVKTDSRFFGGMSIEFDEEIIRCGTVGDYIEKLEEITKLETYGTIYARCQFYFENGERRSLEEMLQYLRQIEQSEFVQKILPMEWRPTSQIHKPFNDGEKYLDDMSLIVLKKKVRRYDQYKWCRDDMRLQFCCGHSNLPACVKRKFLVPEPFKNGNIGEVCALAVYYAGQLYQFPDFEIRDMRMRKPTTVKLRTEELLQFEEIDRDIIPPPPEFDREHFIGERKKENIRKIKQMEEDRPTFLSTSAERRAYDRDCMRKVVMDDLYHERFELYNITKEERDNLSFMRFHLRSAVEGTFAEGAPASEKTDVPFNNVLIDMGVRKESIPQELLNYLLNSSCAASMVRCDHCQKMTVFLYGDIKHHVCATCYANESSCDDCILYPKKNQRFWIVPFICLYQHCLIFKLEQNNGQHQETSGYMLWLFIALRGLTTIAYTMAIAKILSVFPCSRFIKLVVGMVGTFMLKDNTYMSPIIFQQQQPHLPIAWDEDKFNTFIDQRDNYVQTPCEHHRLLEYAQWEYMGEQWQIEDEAWSIFPCATDCCLFDGNNMARYKERCKRFAERNQFLMNESLVARNDEYGLEEFLLTIPPFMRTVVLDIPAQFEDRFEAQRRRKYRSIFNRFYNRVMRVLQMNPTWKLLKILGACGALLISAVVALRGVCNLWSWFRGSETREQDQYDRAQMRHFSRAIRKPQINKVTKQTDSEYMNALTTKVFKNTFSFVVLSGNSIVHEMVGIGVQHRVAILPRHYVIALRDWALHEVEIQIRFPAYPQMHISYEFDEVDFLESSTTDIAIFYAPKTVNEFKNIYGYFANEVDFKTPLPRNGLLMESAKISSPYVKTHDLMMYGLDKTEVDRDGETIRLDDMLKYNYSKQGACGSLIIRLNSTRPIIGMHVAGTTKNSWNQFGYGVPVTQEMFEQEFINHKKTTRNVYDEKEQDEFEAKLIFEDKVAVQSLYATERAMHIPMKTKIRPSLLHNYDGEPKTRPCYLSSFEPGYLHGVSPLVAGAAKHGILTKNFPTTRLNEVKEVLYQKKYAQMKPLIAQPKRLTIGESIRGFSIDGYEQLKLDTSMGYPYCLGPLKQKRDYISVTEEQVNEERKVFIQRDVLKHVQDVLELKRRGEILELPVIDNVKDERKKIEKINRLGGTRVYCMSAFANTISNRMNFLHFAAAYKANRFLLQHAVGVTVNGPEWGVIAKTLLANSPHIVTLDYSNFGPGYNAGVNACGHDIITRWTLENVEGVDETEMYILGEEHYNSVHLMGDLVYKQLSGGPSGDALTVVKNGLVNELYILLAWSYLYDENVEPGVYNKYEAYFDHVVLYTYGDDAIMSITPDVISWFNGETISEFFSRYGIVATDAEKSGAIQRYKDISVATFLKSGFKPHPKHHGEWLAPLDTISITETPRWIFDCEDYVMATKQNVEMAMQLAYGHGREYFDKIRSKLLEKSREVGVPATFLTWEEIDAMFFPAYNKHIGMKKLPIVRHKHVCIKCGVEYMHEHGMGNYDHPQFRDQCPNDGCDWYHKDNNTTISELVTASI